MNFKRNGLLLIIVLTISILLIGTSFAAEEETYIDPDIPESWYESPKTASEMGITEFNQSPMLDEKVTNGEIPPVEERLPDNPVVIEPYKEIGKYGGTANVWGTSLDYGGDIRYLEMAPTAGQPTPDGKKIVPFYVKDWEFSNNYKNLTIHLREGVKYSDGTPFTADEYLYWWEHEAHNQDLNPIPPEEWTPIPLIEVTKEDDYTVTFHYKKPNPRIVDFTFKDNMGISWGELPSSDYMKQFHPDFAGKDKVKEMAEEVELDTWYDYYNRIRDDSIVHPEYEYQRSTLRPYIVTERSETTLLLERNPYYPFVDTKGNQLPYIDKIKVNLANSNEMAATKATTGEATLGGRFTKTNDIPLYKNNEEQENYETFIYYRAYGSDVTVMPNLSHEDSNIREIFQDLRFRKALSLAVDRENINRKIYYDQGKPMQNTVAPLNSFYKEEYAQSYAEYDPARAKELLDKMGMTDKNNDGYRETPDGEKFNPTLTYCKMGPVEPSSIIELLINNWKEIGLNIDDKMVSQELWYQRGMANNLEMTVWTTDQVLDLTFGMKGSGISRGFAPLITGAGNSFVGWGNWYNTKGEEGVEPPEHIKELIELGEVLGYSPDKEERNKAGEKLVEIQANEVRAIGTVGMPPQPIIVSNDLKNVPKKGLWDWSIRYMRPMYPIQFYLEK